MHDYTEKGEKYVRMKQYNWVVIGREQKHPVSYDVTHNRLIVDGRHVEIIRKRNMKVDDFQLPIDDAKAIFHTEGTYADVYVNGTSLNGVKDARDTTSIDNSYYTICCVLNTLCIITAQVYGMLLGTLGLVLCFYIRWYMSDPSQRRVRKYISIGASFICLIITLVVMLYTYLT